MSQRFAVIRQGQELTRVNGVDHCIMQLVPPLITFYDEYEQPITEIEAELGDVVQPVVVGFHNPFPPIDQSEQKIEELRRKYKLATSIDWLKVKKG